MNPILSHEHGLRTEALLYKADGTEEAVRPKDGRKFTLEELQRMVGGYIEVVPLSEGRLMVLNEEGKLKGLPMNRAASVFALPHIGTGDFIVGDALVCDVALLD